MEENLTREQTKGRRWKKERYSRVKISRRGLLLAKQSSNNLDLLEGICAKEYGFLSYNVFILAFGSKFLVKFVKINFKSYSRIFFRLFALITII